ncbi:MAG: DNA repair protein RecO [Myxococcales bacterium FL481]|nr:MAG: DNA repair protein RecO [Myxococcales bacterium FL481]
MATGCGDVSGRQQRSPAVVLRVRPVRESDLMLVLLTRERGRIDAVARGARRSRRRFPGGLAVGQRGVATLASGRGDVWRLDEFECEGDHGAIGRDLERFAYVAYVCEVAEALISGTEPDDRAFALIDDAIRELVDDRPHPAVLRSVELRLLDTLGLAPALTTCAVCRTALPLSAVSEVAFDHRRGGALCRLHAAGARPVDTATIEAAAQLLVVDRPRAFVDGLSRPERRSVRDLCLAAIHHHVARPLRSAGFFASLALPPDDPRSPSQS